MRSVFLALLLMIGGLALAANAGEGPAVAFDVDVLDPRPGQPVTFRDASRAVPANATRLWEFGDGDTAWGRNVTHVYQAEGIYTVTLRILNSSAVRTVAVSLPAPQAAFEVQPATIGVGEQAIFIDRSHDEDDLIVSWLWDFGDGVQVRDELRPRHAYAQTGEFTVTLQVQDQAGHRANATRVVQVLDQVGSVGLPSAINPDDPGFAEYGTPGVEASLGLAALATALLLRRRI